jgi:pyridoxal phosphate enzyme (YggS family)
VSSRKEELAQNLALVEARIEGALAQSGRRRDEITLIAVTKFFPASDAMHLYDLGLRHFGENRDSDGAQKSAELPADIHWHFQGQIQSRKISSILGWAQTIHSLDSYDHAEKCSRFLSADDLEREFFIQVNLEPERSDRGGVAKPEIPAFYESIRKLPHIKVSGLMCVLPLAAEPISAFSDLAKLVDQLELPSLSLGMSGDFEAAILSGATHIRVGSSILGSRPDPA